MSSLQIRVLSLGELQTNCYVLWSEDSHDAVIIDPADSGDLLSSFILEENLNLQATILTHGHFDHCLGLLELSLNFAVPTYIHPEDIFLIQNAQKSAQHWLKHAVDPVPLPSHRILDGQTIQCADFTLHAIHTPGHTPGSTCFKLSPDTTTAAIYIDGTQIIPGTSVVFTGDTVFKDSFPDTRHPYSSVLQLNESWHKLKELDPETTLLPGHGEYCTLSETAVYKI